MNRISSVSRHQGFSLIELMIAMVIGLILLAGVGTVFVSAQQTSQIKRDLDNAQEALRYVHQSVSRIVRVGTIDDSSDGEKLIITMNRSAAIPDCLGKDNEGEVTVEYSLNGNHLECSVDGETGIVARNVTTFGIQYESLNGNAWNDTDSTDAVSVRVSLAFGDFVATSFVATSRTAVLNGI